MKKVFLFITFTIVSLSINAQNVGSDEKAQSNVAQKTNSDDPSQKNINQMVTQLAAEYGVVFGKTTFAEIQSQNPGKLDKKNPNIWEGKNGVTYAKTDGSDYIHGITIKRSKIKDLPSAFAGIDLNGSAVEWESWLHSKGLQTHFRTISKALGVYELYSQGTQYRIHLFSIGAGKSRKTLDRIAIAVSD